MIKTLRITGIVAAVLAGGLLVFPFIFGFRKDAAVEQFLKAPSVIDEFRNAAADRRGKPEKGQASPLVTQAGLFAEYLNPKQPPVITQRPSRQTPSNVKTVAPPPPSVSAKFTVLGTSYNQSRPEESLALIDAPGKGVHWIRQSGKVGHLTLEIQDGLVIAKAAGKSFEMPVKRKPQISLLAGSSPSQTPSGLEPALNLPQETPASQHTIGSQPSRTDVRKPTSAEEKAAFKEIMATLQAGSVSGSAEQGEELDASGMGEILAQLQALKQSKSNKIDSQTEIAEDTRPHAQAIPSPEADRITGEEASNLEHLGQELNKASSRDERTRILEQRRELRKRRADMLRRRIERAKSTASDRDAGEQ
jgi:hypothetical protein